VKSLVAGVGTCVIAAGLLALLMGYPVYAVVILAFGVATVIVAARS
jgi:hypothetical protein